MTAASEQAGGGERVACKSLVQTDTITAELMLHLSILAMQMPAEIATF